MKLVSHEHIEMRPSPIHDDVAVIAGTRIRVIDVYAWHEVQHMSAQEIVEQFPHLTPADVHAAMAYYWDHQDEIHNQMAAAHQIEEDMRKKHPPKLPEALKRRNANGDSVSS
jgi:uncharacterized protein (DUF433 family)